MDYEKKIRDYMNSSEVDQLYKSMLSNLFPELVEPQEEKARRSLLEFLEDLFKLGKNINFDRWSKADCEEWVNWVMKQGKSAEINPSEFDLRLNKLLKRFEPLPKEEITGILNFYLNVIQNDGIYKEEKQGEQKPADKVSLNFKKGDILYEQKTMSILLVYERNGSWLMTFCDYWMLKEKFHVEFPYERYGFVQEMSLVPATKEQRDLLFQKMKEAGYEWDAEKKELKKIERKPVEWSEEDEKMALSIEQIFNCASLLNIVPDKIEKVKSWLKSLKERCTWKPSDEQIKVCKEVYADILSAKGFDLGTVNSELNRLEEELKKLKK